MILLSQRQIKKILTLPEHSCTILYNFVVVDIDCVESAQHHHLPLVDLHFYSEKDQNYVLVMFIVCLSLLVFGYNILF